MCIYICIYIFRKRKLSRNMSIHRVIGKLFDHNARCGIFVARLLSHVWLFVTTCEFHQAPLSSTSLVTQLVKNPPPMPETWVWSLSWEDPLEKEKAIHSNILAWRFPWTLWAMGHKKLDTTEWPSQSLLKFMSIESVMLSKNQILCCLLCLLPSIFPSIKVFSTEFALHITWPKYWSFNFCISYSNEYSGLISFRIDWFDIPVAQGTLKSLLQHHNSEA